MKKEIERGDIVHIDFGGRTLNNCEVLYVPCAEGDSWHLRTENGKLIYVQKFETMKLK